MCTNALKNEFHVSIRKLRHRAITKLMNDSTVSDQGSAASEPTLFPVTSYSLTVTLAVSEGGPCCSENGGGYLGTP